MKSILSRFAIFLTFLSSAATFAAEESSSIKTDKVKGYAGPTLAANSGVVGYGLSVGAYLPFSYPMPLTVGLETGYIRVGNDFDFHVNVFPLRVMAAYHPEIAFFSNSTHPYVGVLFGAGLYIPSSETTPTRFAIEQLIRPGVLINLSSDYDLAIEPRFGLVAGTFLFQPQIALEVGL